MDTRRQGVSLFSFEKKPASMVKNHSFFFQQQKWLAILIMAAQASRAGCHPMAIILRAGGRK
jgi:hypothetical protein